MLLEQIKYQVQLNECVIIPSFGAIVSNYVPARILEGENSRMLPPSKKMVFNERLQHDDGKFIKNVADDLGITYTEAEKKVAEFVADAKERIFAGEIFLIDGVGAFSTFDGQSIVFEPALLDSVLVDSFGLSAFQTPVIDSSITRKTFEQTVQNKGGIGNIVKSKQFIRVAVIAPIVIAIGLLLPINTKMFKTEKAGVAIVSDDYVNTLADTFSNPVEQELMSNVNKKNALKYIEHETAVSLPVETISESELAKAEITIEPETIAESLIEEDNSGFFDSEIAVEEKRFFIIVGVFTEKYNAENLKDQLSSSGFESQIFERGGKYKVSLDTYNSKESALEELTELASIDSDFFSGAWVMEE